MKIGKLERVKLRDVWNNEAFDFTTWLNKNLETLGEAIGLNLFDSETEKRLNNSSFHADIVTNTEDGKCVIIENQLESTDHKHLGQILTYMVNMDSKIAVWVTKKPRPEHIKVINWLNEETENDFYLVQVEAYQINNSDPAPFFSVICRPSTEMKAIGKEKKELNERERAKIKFWDTLLKKSEGKTDLFSNKSSTSWTVLHLKTNLNHMRLACHINKNTSSIGFICRDTFRQKFLKIKDEIEEALGFTLDFELVGVRTGTFPYRFRKYFQTGGYRDQEKWDEVQEEMLDNMIKLDEVLKKYSAKLNVSRDDKLNREQKTIELKKQSA